MPKTPTISKRTRRAAIYLRISKDKRKEAGVTRQENECRELAKRLGWDVVAVYVDNDVEASSGKKRPSYEKLLAAMRDGSVDAVIGWHMDRIVRRPNELEDLILIADEHGVLFNAVRVGEIDLRTASGRLIARLLGAAAKYETELKAERQASQLKQRAYAGQTTGGGTRPYGYEKGRVAVRRDEAAIIRNLAERVLAGESVYPMADELNTKGCPTASWKGVPFRMAPWTPLVIKRMLTNPALAGKAVYKGEIVADGVWEPIIDFDTHKALVSALTYSGPPPRNRARVALLPGVIWCSRCGYELVTAQQWRPAKEDGSSGNVRIYSCREYTLPGRKGYQKSCGRINIKADLIENDIAERILARLCHPESVGLLKRAAQGRLAAGSDPAADDVASLEKRLRELGRDYADELIGRTEFIAARDRLEERRGAALKLIRSRAEPILDLPYGDPEKMAAWWESAPLAKKQIVVRQQIAKIEVGPHTGRRSDYNPNRVEVVWRD